MENRTILNNTNNILGGDNMKERTILEGQLVDLITKKGELVHSTVNGEFYSYEYVLEKGNLTFILSLRDRDITIQHDEIGEIDGMSFARKEEIYSDEYGLQLYIDYINSSAETLEKFIEDKYVDRIVSLSDFLNLFEYIESVTEDIDLDDYNTCNKALKEFGINLYVEDFDIDMELVIFRRDME